MESGQRGIVPPRTPDARFAQSKEASIRPQLYAPTLRCRCGATPRRPQQNRCMGKVGFHPLSLVDFGVFSGERQLDCHCEEAVVVG